MRIRLPFAGAFLFLLAAAGYAGLTSLQVDVYANDKVLHCITFFVLTTCFYWILDTTRRRNLNLTLLICTGILGVGSEIVQHLIPNDRIFDLYDIVANVVGSLAAVALSSWYHMRMLERKRLGKQYQVVPGEEDLELGEGIGALESGTVSSIPAPARTLDEEVDNWDENVEDNWDDEEHATTDSAEGAALNTPSASSVGEADVDTKKRAD